MSARPEILAPAGDFVCLQAALDAASAELFNPTPTTDFAEANRKVRTLQFEIDRYTAEWEEAATELEELKKEQ